MGMRHAYRADGLHIGGIDSYLDLWEIEKEMNAVIVAFITGGLSLIGVIITNISSNKKIENQLEVAMAVTNTKLDALTKQVCFSTTRTIRSASSRCRSSTTCIPATPTRSRTSSRARYTGAARPGRSRRSPAAP